MPGLNFAFTADHSNMRSALAEINSGLNKVKSEAEQAGVSLDDLFRQASKVATFSFAGWGIERFANKVKETRMYFQDIESTMRVFLGNAEKADQFTSELKDYAWYNMFDFADLADASKQLIAYRNDVNDIIPIIDKLSNIATATHQPLNEMVNLYNRAKSTGVVDANSLQSWAVKGVLVKDTLKEMGEYTDGQRIKFEDLNKVLDKLTSEGGMFHGIMDEQMENISAEVGQLEDNLDAMFNEIGEKSEGLITAIVKGIAWAIDNYQKIGGVALTAISALGIYKGSVLASEFAMKKAAEERSRAVVEGYEEEIAKLKEYQDQQKYDEDINSAVSSGSITSEMADKLQALREEMRLREEAANKAKEAADKEVYAAKEAVDAANEKLQKAEEELEAAFKKGDADDISAAAEAKKAAQTEVASAAIALETAEENANAAATQVSTVRTQADTIAEIQNANATRTNTTAEVTNTAAKKQGAIATALSTAKTKISIVTHHLLTSAINGVKTALNGLKAAWISNPIGLIITGLTTAIGLFMTFKDETEEATKDTETFGEEAVKTRNKVEMLYGIIQTANKETELYKNALKELSEEAKQHGIVLDDEKDLYQQLIEDRERFIRLLEEEGRQKMLNKQIEGYTEDIDNAAEKSIKEFSDNIKKHSDGNAKEYADQFAKVLQATIDDKADELNERLNAYDEIVKERDRRLAEKGPDMVKDVADAERLTQIEQEIAKIVNENGQKLAEQLGVGEDFAVDNLKIFKTAKKYLEDVNVAKQSLDAKLKILQESEAFTKENTDEKPFDFDSAPLDDLLKKMEESSEKASELNGKEIKPSVDSSEIEETSEKTDDAKEKVDELDDKTAKPSTDNSEIEATKSSAETAGAAVDRLNSKSGAPKVSTVWIDNFKKALDEAWQGLQKFFGQTQTSLFPGGKSGGTAVGNAAGALGRTVNNTGQQKNQAQSDFKKSVDAVRKQIADADDDNTLLALKKSLDDAIKGAGYDTEYRKNLQSLSKEADAKIKQHSGKSSGKKGKSKKSGESAEQIAAKEAGAARRLIDQMARAAEERYKQQMEYEFNLWQGRIDLMDEGEQKVLEQQRLNFKKEQYQLQQQKKAAIKSEIDRQKAEFDARENQNAVGKKKYVKKTFDSGSSSLQASLEEYVKKGKEIETIRKKLESPVDSEIINIDEAEEQIKKLEAEQEELKNEFGNVDIEPLIEMLEQYGNLLDQQNEKQKKANEERLEEQRAAYNEYLREFGSYLEKRNAIEEEYNKKIDDATTSGQRMTLLAQKDQALANLDFEEWIENGDLALAFGDIEKLSSSTIDMLVKDMERYRSKIISTLDPDKIQKYEDALSKLRSVSISSRFYFGGDDSLLQSLQERVALQKQLNDEEANSIALEQQRIILESELKSAEASVMNIEQNLPTDEFGNKEYSEEFEEAKKQVEKIKVNLDKVNKSLTTSKKNSAQLRSQLETLGELDFADIKKFSKDILETSRNATGLAEVFSDDVAESIDTAIETLDGLLDAFSTLSSKIDILANSTINLVEDTTGAAQTLVEGAGEGMKATAATTSGSLKALESASAILAIIGAAIQVATMIAKLVNPDKKHEKNIEKLQERVDDLKDAYDDLGDAVNRAYGTDADKLIEQQNKNLEMQKALIQQQMGEENAKKKTDDDKIKDYQNQLKEIDKQIAENRESAKEAIIGSDLKSAISDFADAYISAWEDGTDAAKSSMKAVGALVKSTLSNMLKQHVQPLVEDFYDYLYEVSKKGYITDEELAYLDELNAKINDAAESDREVYQYVHDRYKDIEELQEELTNMSFDSLRDNFKSLLADMESSTADFAESFTDMLRDALLEGLMVDKYDSMLKDWYQSFYEAMEDHTLTDEERDSLWSQYNDIVQQGIADRDAINAILGGGAYSQNASKGAWASMDQDTAGELNGRFTAMVELEATNNVLVGEGNDLLRQLIATTVQANAKPILASDDNSVSDIRDMMVLSTGYLEDISKYTKNLSSILSEISEMKQSIQRL